MLFLITKIIYIYCRKCETFRKMGEKILNMYNSTKRELLKVFWIIPFQMNQHTHTYAYIYIYTHEIMDCFQKIRIQLYFFVTCFFLFHLS